MQTTTLYYELARIEKFKSIKKKKKKPYKAHVIKYQDKLATQLLEGCWI